MASESEKFDLQFPQWYDALAETEMANQGFLSGVVVRRADGRRYPVCFADLGYVQEEAPSQFEQGNACFAEPGLVVVPEVTRDAMRRAVARLLEAGYFDHLKPLS